MVVKNFFHKYILLPIQVKAGIWFVFCNILVKAISFITVPIFTRLIPTSEYGNLTVYLSSTEIILILTSWDISYGAYQKGLYKYDDVSFFTKVVQLSCTVWTIFLFILLRLLYPVLGDWLSIPSKLYPYLFIYLITQPAYRNWMALKQKNYEYKNVVIVSILYSLTISIIPMFAVYFVERSADVKYITQMAASSAIFFTFFVKNANIKCLLKEKQNVKEQLSFIVLFQFPCLIHSLSLVILSQADRIMIKRFIGSSEAALYGVAYSVSFVLIVIQNGLNSAMTPWRYELMQKKDYNQLNKISCTLLLVIGTGVCVFMLIAPELMKVIFTAEYYDAINCIPPMAISIYFIALYSIFVGIEGYFENTKSIMYIAIGCSFINILMNYFGIKVFGYKACAYTTMSTYLLFCILHYFSMKKICSKYITVNIFNIKEIILYSMLFFIFSMAMILLYKMQIIRYCLFFILLLMGYIKRDKIKSMVNTIKKGESKNGTY